MNLKAIYTNVIENPRKHQIIKWSLPQNFSLEASNYLRTFFQRLGFQSSELIALQMHHETKGYFMEGDLSVNRLQEFPIGQLAVTCNTRQYKNVTKYLRTENENGFGLFFAALGTRKDTLQQRIRFHFVDVDMGKDVVGGLTEQEAHQKQTEMLTEPYYSTVNVVEHRKSWKVVGQLNQDAIQLRKTAYLDRFKQDLKTAIVVETFNGFHIYFVVSHADISLYSQVQTALAQHFEGDMAMKDTARILRVPYFFHVKYPSTPFFVQVKHWGMQDAQGDWVTHTQNKLIQLFNLKLTTEHVEMFSSTPAQAELRKVKAKYTKLHPVDTVAYVFKDVEGNATTTLSLADFVEQIKYVPLTKLFQNTELHTPLGENFSCLYHEDKHPSATTYRTESGISVYKCFATSCKAHSYTAIDMIMASFEVGFLDAVTYLSNLCNITIVHTPFQQKVFELVHQNLQWVKRNLECANVRMAEKPALYGYISESMKRLLKELMVQLLSYPLQEKWARDGLPIFFASADYLVKECKQTRKTVQHNIDILTLLGFLDKVPHNEVPASLYRKTGRQLAVNYYTLASFDEIAPKAEALILQLKEQKFRKKDMSFEYVHAALGAEVARKVYPNQASYRVTQKQKLYVGEVSEPTMRMYQLTEAILKKHFSKKAYMKEDTLFTQVAVELANEDLRLQGSQWRATKQRTIMHLKGLGYVRTTLTKEVAASLGLKRSQGKGERIYVWLKKGRTV